MLLNLKGDIREVLLRSFFILFVTTLILVLSIDKISVAFKFKTVAPLISMQIQDLTGFPVWSSFICGPQLTSLVIETLKRGRKPNGKDEAKPLAGNYVYQTTTDSLAAGDWAEKDGPWPCFVFQPRKEISFKIGEVDQIILTAFVNEGVQVQPSPNGLLFGIFDDERNMSTVQPFAGPIPSLNTFTFTRSERLDVNNVTHSYFFVNQQNSVSQPNGFNATTLAAKFSYSPDSYSVIKYTERIPYTPYDLISAVGGLITYAIAAWFILFGRGKYRSWGLVQRYLLRTSPNASKIDDALFEKNNDIESNTIVGASTNEHKFSPTYYFSATGTPTQTNFASSSPSSQIQLVKDLNKRIDARINQKLWFVEQTLSRHYLAGFRLRIYDHDSKKLGLESPLSSYDREEEETLTPPTAHHNWNNLDSDIRNPDQNELRKFQVTSSSRGNQYIQNVDDNYSASSLNPEAIRRQYPNVTIGQVPSEKKQKGKNGGSENYTNSSINSTNYPQISQSDDTNTNN